MPESPVREALRRLRRDAKWSWEYRSGLVRRFVVSRWRERFVPRAERDRTQERRFADLGLSRAAGLAEIDRALAACGLGAYDEDDDMFSEHLVLLAALALRHRGACRVLEIGTYDGRTALVLAELFPDAEIVSVDLPAADPVYGESYQFSRATDFEERRAAVLRRCPRVRFVARNSLGLVHEPGGAYDVVWVDGDHQFPVIAVDLANAVRLLRPGGYLLCDDVFVARTRRSSIYLSDAAHRSLGALRDAGLIETPTYLYKRLGTPHQSPRKFVAIAATRGG
jgi:predicted O-methyltransferase YrrM